MSCFRELYFSPNNWKSSFYPKSRFALETMDLHHLWGGPFAVHKVAGNLSVSRWCKIIIWWSFASRNLRDIYRLQGFGTQIELRQRARAINARARVGGKRKSHQSLGGETSLGSPRDSKHNGEPQRGTTREPPWRAPKKRKWNRKQNKRFQFILKLKSFILSNIFQQSLSRHSVDHFKIIAMIFGHMFPMSFSKKMLQNKDFYL